VDLESYEEYLAAVTIGELQPLANRIELVDHDPAGLCSSADAKTAVIRQILARAEAATG
jgi:hypothetical protein